MFLICGAKIQIHFFFLYYRQSESPPPQRSLSELELFKQKHNLPEEGEFYTAIGPDGKKVLLSKKQKNFYYRKSKHHQKPKLWDLDLMVFFIFFLYFFISMRNII